MLAQHRLGTARLTFVLCGWIGWLALVQMHSTAEAELQYGVNWQEQLGTSSEDYSSCVAVDATGNAFISGYTYGSLGGTQAGDGDIFLSKFNNSGSLLWTKQLGTSHEDTTLGVAVDVAGNPFICGYTLGSLGGTNQGDFDAFLCKFSSDGVVQWKRQLGTGVEDSSCGVAMDAAGNAFVCGSTLGSLGGTNKGSVDAFLSKYNNSGVLQWTKQIGTGSNDSSRGLDVDGAGNVFIAGDTQGSLGGPNAGSSDAFLSKYTNAGDLVWIRQFGTNSQDGVGGVAVDAMGNVLVTGATYGSLGGAHAGAFDIYLRKYSSEGDVLWTSQLGTSSYDVAFGVALDTGGNVFVSGYTNGSLGGAQLGKGNVILCEFSSMGDLLWTKQLGTGEFDYSKGVTVDGTGQVFITGNTNGPLGGAYSGGGDAFLVQLAVPEPSNITLLLSACGTGLLICLLRRQ